MNRLLLFVPRQRIFSSSYNHHIHPATTTKCMRQHSNVHSRTTAKNLNTTINRWNRNVQRLYARRILEILTASAASYKVVSGMEAGADGEFVPTPTNWKNWIEKDWTDELLQSIGASKVERFCKATLRLITLGALASPLAILLPLSTYVSPQIFQPIAWNYAIWGIEQAGPTLIKLIQWATTRQDLFSTEFCQHFGKLRDDTTGHTWEETVAILQQDIGDDYQEYLQIHPIPIGSGCIAQVYRGYLMKPTSKHPKGTKVAIKVQHPGIWEKVCTDFYILGKLSKLLEALPYLHLEYLALQDTVQQFRNVMLPQLNLTLEAKHLQRFNRDFGNDDRVSFPHPLNELTSKSVLTETFVSGNSILEYVHAPKEVREQLALLGIKTTLKMIFLNDFVHGDLHPGNILVSEHDTLDHDYTDYDDDDETKNNQIMKFWNRISGAANKAVDTANTTIQNINKKPQNCADIHTTPSGAKIGDINKKLRLHLLDCGLVLEMGPEQHVNLVRILGAFTRRDGTLAGQLMVDTSRNSRSATPINVECFINGIEMICREDEDQNFLEKIGDYISDICYLACKNKVKLEGAFVNAALAVEIMEGIAQQIYPELHVQTIALPIVMKAEMMHRLGQSISGW